MAVNKSRDLVLAAEFYGQPVKFLEKRCYVILSSFFNHEPCCKVQTTRTEKSGVYVNSSACIPPP